MRKCSLTNLDALLRTMADTATVYLPVDGTDGRAHFTKWEDGVKMSDALNTVRPRPRIWWISRWKEKPSR